MITKLNKMIYTLLIAIIASANISQTSLAAKSSQTAIKEQNSVQDNNATLAVEMNGKPFQTDGVGPNFCPTVGEQLHDIFLDTMEGGSTNWVFGATTGYTSDWSITTPGVSSPTHSLFGPDEIYPNDSYAAMSLDISIPSGTTPYLYFYHRYDLEFYTGGIGYDGGVVEYSTDHGGSWHDAQPLFSAGQNYNATLYVGTENPLEGRSAFSGNSGGTVGSRYNLSSLIGNSVRFRWRIGSDNTNDTPGAGWFVDDVQIYTCSSGKHSLYDFNGDGKTEVAIYRPGNAAWYINGVGTTYWGGVPGDIPVPADYNGDGKTEIAIYRSNAAWYINGVGTSYWGGMPGDIPVPTDYNGDGVVDIAIYRPSNGAWYINGVGTIYWGGVAGDIPVPADYNGDGVTEVAIYRPGNAAWYIRGLGTTYWGGVANDIPVPADYNGDGLTDIAIYRPGNAAWYINGVGTVYWGGVPGDIPVPGDYNADGVTEIAIYRSNAAWYIRGIGTTYWGGMPNDYPIPARDTNGDGDPYQ